MGLLGLDALQWFVVLDLFVLMGSTTIAAALFVRLRARERVYARAREASDARLGDAGPSPAPTAPPEA